MVIIGNGNIEELYSNKFYACAWGGKGRNSITRFARPLASA